MLPGQRVALSFQSWDAADVDMDSTCRTGNVLGPSSGGGEDWSVGFDPGSLLASLDIRSVNGAAASKG